MTPNLSHMLVGVAVIAYILWRFYVRLRRTIGRQKFRPGMLKFYVALYALASVGIGAFSLAYPKLLLGWAGGLVPGIALGLWALRLTRFETVEEGNGYTPNARIGIALFLLFVGRIAYRVISVDYSHASMFGHPPPAVGQSALTYLVFELLAGYFLAYNIGVLLHYRKRAKPAASSG